ncbi:hypothetical protein ABZV91_07590 [Nocardia sp. NPDC004568]|uniref:hypothetical protein n=1 Tax=Nocardia sp. NPDC004568 TaxID=3154551 RepID=UPI0033BFAE06
MLERNRSEVRQIPGDTEWVVVPGATHFFAEPEPWNGSPNWLAVDLSRGRRLYLPTGAAPRALRC